MEFLWKITARDVRKIREVVASQRCAPFVRRRFSRNIGGNHATPSKGRFWKAHLMGLLTTQQRSGPTSAVTRFLGAKPFPLTYGHCAKARNAEAFVAAALRSHGGIRRINTISDQAARNLDYLRSGGWRQIQPYLAKLHARHRPVSERRAADFLADRIVGLGPKQSRNVLQALGLTRHEIPLDSRVTSWLNEKLEINVALAPSSLSDREYYAFVSDAVQSLCKRANTYPCVLDAAIFSSFDEEPWEEESPF